MECHHARRHPVPQLFFANFSAFTLRPDARIIAVGYVEGNMNYGYGARTNNDGNANAVIDEDKLKLFELGAHISVIPTTISPAVALWDLTTGALLHAFKRISEDTICPAFSPDGGVTLSTKLFTLEWSRDGKLLAAMIVDEPEKPLNQIWDLASRAGRSLRVDGVAGHLAFTRDGRQLLAAFNSGLYQLWDVTTGAIIGERDNSMLPNYLRFSKVGKIIDTGIQRFAVVSFYPDWKPRASTGISEAIRGRWSGGLELTGLAIEGDDAAEDAGRAALEIVVEQAGGAEGLIGVEDVGAGFDGGELGWEG
ncbi:hypothetical protein BJX65DRAFT_311556 [Aspergillus insuetus]